jgi:hypothetical protein
MNFIMIEPFECIHYVDEVPRQFALATLTINIIHDRLDR